MFLSGFADEAGQSIETQICAHKELEFQHIEMRLVDGEQFTQLSDTDFDAVVGELNDAGIQISCYGSAIGNWARPVTGDFGVDLEDLKRSIPRMQKTGTPIIRIMSWPNNCLSQEQWRDTTVSRMKELAKLAEDGGITLGLENCTGYASQSATTMLEFISLVDSPALKMIFDTGNSPSYGLNSLDVYTQVKAHIAYIHIKDSYVDSDGKAHFTQPNCGHGYVRQILSDLEASDYDGCISIEPHVAAVVHTGEDSEDEEAKYQSYIEYGTNLKKLVQGIW